jgi:hypothetical protein
MAYSVQHMNELVNPQNEFRDETTVQSQEGYDQEMESHYEYLLCGPTQDDLGY